MFSTELIAAQRKPTAYRRDFYLTVVIMAFTMAQIWAFAVVMITVRPSGPTELALGLTLVGSTIAVINGWRHIVRRSRNHIGEE
jgi:hypothetical protein